MRFGLNYFFVKRALTITTAVVASIDVILESGKGSRQDEQSGIIKCKPGIIFGRDSLMCYRAGLTYCATVIFTCDLFVFSQSGVT